MWAVLWCSKTRQLKDSTQECHDKGKVKLHLDVLCLTQLHFVPGPKSQKKFKRLMMHRIKWVEHSSKRDGKEI